MRNMREMINARSEDAMNRHGGPRVAEIAIAPDGGSFSIIAENGAEGSAQVSLTADELPRLIVALLRTAAFLERGRGDDRSLIFPIEKGSIAVQGTSLTIAAVDGAGFAVALIPHTLTATTLGELEPGDAVNLEADVLAKYVERLLEAPR